MRRILNIFLIAALIFAGSVLRNRIRFYYGWEDALYRTLMSPFEDTIWAPGFSDAAFEHARINMSKEDITNLLGKPLRKDCGNDAECIWIYTWHVSGTDDFDQRRVFFDKLGKVSELRKSFFID